MKLLPSLATVTAALFLSAGTTSAQTVAIGYPPAGTVTRVKAGGGFTFELDRLSYFDFAGPVTEKSIIVGLHTCQTKCKYDLKKDLGKQVHWDTFNPSYHETWKPKYQNFTVTIPSDTQKGPALLGVRRTSTYPVYQKEKTSVQNFGIDLDIL